MVAQVEVIVDDIIDDVIKSTNQQPSVPGVVMDTVHDVIQEVDDLKNENVENENEENTSYELTDIDDVIKNEIEKDDVILPSEKYNAMDNVEMEVQEIKITVGEDEEKEDKINMQTSDNKDPSSITINGQPVPSTGTIVLNGHVVAIKDSSEKEVENKKVEETTSTVDKENVMNKSMDVIPQTDLDTFETKNVKEPKNVNNSANVPSSNPDDDLSKSDSESVATVDSEENRKSIADPEETEKVTTRKKNIRSRTVSTCIVIIYACNVTGVSHTER